MATGTAIRAGRKRMGRKPDLDVDLALFEISLSEQCDIYLEGTQSRLYLPLTLYFTEVLYKSRLYNTTT